MMNMIFIVFIIFNIPLLYCYYVTPYYLTKIPIQNVFNSEYSYFWKQNNLNMHVVKKNSERFYKYKTNNSRNWNSKVKKNNRKYENIKSKYYYNQFKYDIFNDKKMSNLNGQIGLNLSDVKNAFIDILNGKQPSNADIAFKNEFKKFKNDNRFYEFYSFIDKLPTNYKFPMFLDKKGKNTSPRMMSYNKSGFIITYFRTEYITGKLEGKPILTGPLISSRTGTLTPLGEIVSPLLYDNSFILLFLLLKYDPFNPLNPSNDEHSPDNPFLYDILPEDMIQDEYNPNGDQEPIYKDNPNDNPTNNPNKYPQDQTPPDDDNPNGTSPNLPDILNGKKITKFSNFDVIDYPFRYGQLDKATNEPLFPATFDDLENNNPDLLTKNDDGTYIYSPYSDTRTQNMYTEFNFPQNDGSIKKVMIPTDKITDFSNEKDKFSLPDAPIPFYPDEMPGSPIYGSPRDLYPLNQNYYLPGEKIDKPKDHPFYIPQLYKQEIVSNPTEIIIESPNKYIFGRYEATPTSESKFKPAVETFENKPKIETYYTITQTNKYVYNPENRPLQPNNNQIEDKKLSFIKGSNNITSSYDSPVTSYSYYTTVIQMPYQENNEDGNNSNMPKTINLTTDSKYQNEPDPISGYLPYKKAPAEINIKNPILGTEFTTESNEYKKKYMTSQINNGGQNKTESTTWNKVAEEEDPNENNLKNIGDNDNFVPFENYKKTLVDKKKGRYKEINISSYSGQETDRTPEIINNNHCMQNTE